MLPARYDDFMITPRPGRGVCKRCYDLSCRNEYCRRCANATVGPSAVVPVSYSIAHEELHEALAGYKRSQGPTARWLGVALAGVLWRFLARHEGCVARSARVKSFDLVTSVPSGDVARDESHPLVRMAGEVVGPLRDRYAPVLRRSPVELTPREFSVWKYQSVRSLAGEAVLLIDDTWTTGASARSATAALAAAGAGPVAVVVIGRHVNREWAENDRLLRSLPPFDWAQCAVCAASPAARRPSYTPVVKLR